MEHLNKIEIKGTIGNVRIQDVADNKVANFSVATDYVYKSKNGEIIIETTWHNVVAWEGGQIQDLSQLKKGSFVHVCGRLRNRKYLASDGSERTVCDILAGSLRVVKDSSI